MQLATLLARDLAVGLVAGFDGRDARLLLVEAIGLARRQRARCDAGVDALLLVGLALVDARRDGSCGLRERADGRDGQRDAGGEGGELVHGGFLGGLSMDRDGLRVPPVYNGTPTRPPTPVP